MALRAGFSTYDAGHLKPVILKPVSRTLCIFRVFVQHFPRFCFVESLQTLVFLGSEGPSAFSALSPYHVGIADFENPTDRLYYERS